VNTQAKNDENTTMHQGHEPQRNQENVGKTLKAFGERGKDGKRSSVGGECRMSLNEIRNA